jgi:hypothetical protein
MRAEGRAQMRLIFATNRNVLGENGRQPTAQIITTTQMR